ncbi:hypothetical protein BaRGS_00007418 [Batillaria attramentaria]|uniref:Uncharacterized protein n=1 Tax=Batillaria attramentaria TaxID=370345 RepID=A0ABD0LP97_9CAEN
MTASCFLQAVQLPALFKATHRRTRLLRQSRQRSYRDNAVGVALPGLQTELNRRECLGSTSASTNFWLHQTAFEDCRTSDHSWRVCEMVNRRRA